ncbi:MAG TPA: NAD(P)H-binding protein [Myxococcaceae bacterium]
MKLIVFGASGRTGKLIIELAANAHHEVTAFVRSPEKLGPVPAGVKVVKGDGHDAAAVEAAMAGQEGALIAVGAEDRKKTTIREDITRNAIAGMKKHGGKRIVYLSASGVGDSLAQAKKLSFIYGYFLIPLMLKHPFADSTAAENLIKASGLEYVLVRAVGLTDGPPKRDVVAVTDGSTEGLKITIPRADVARFMLIAMTEDRYVNQGPALSSA